jgi:hypothetical protein
MGTFAENTDAAAVQIVDAGWTFYQGKVDELFDTAMDAAGALSTLELEAESLGGVDFRVPANITLPGPLSVPTPPELTYQTTDTDGIPVAPHLVTVVADTTSVPTFSLNPPIADLPAMPSPPANTLPSAPTITDRDIPTYTDHTDPTLPDPRAITLPEVPDFTVPEFTALAPSIAGIETPSDAFSYSEEEFSSTTLDEVQAKIQTWLAGDESTGLPDYVWDHIWERENEQEREGAVAAEYEARTEWNRRGFTMPGGVLDAKLAAIRLKILQAENARARDIATKRATMEVENIRFAITQGVAVTQLLGQMFDARMQRAFAIAQYTYQSAIELFTAKIELYKARLAGYQAEATVFETRVRAAVQILEGYRAQLEGQRLIGELNAQDIELYKARWEGIQAAVDVYRTRVQAVTAAIEADRARMEVFRTRVQAYGEQVNAYGQEVGAYQARVGVYDSSVRAFDSSVRAHVARIEGVRATNDVALQNAKMQNEASMQRTEMYKTQVQAWAAGVSAESDRLRALAAVFGGQAQIYESQVRGTEAAARVQVDKYRAAVEEGQAQATLALDKIKVDVAQAQRLTELEVSARGMATTMYGQLSSATMAAVNLSAAISGQDSYSESHNYNYNP